MQYQSNAINTGPFLTSYTLPQLKRLGAHQKMVLPICSLGTPASKLSELGDLILPPLYHEALQRTDIQDRLVRRIRACFPYYHQAPEAGQFDGRFEIVELPRETLESPRNGEILAFSVDTAVEQHGPHLPLATDTIQSYGVLQRLAEDHPQLHLGPPVEYGQLTWGLPFGYSIDITATLLTTYLAAFVDAVMDWAAPRSLYVVDVHGSIVHRAAIEEGLRRSSCRRYCFRWLHEPLIEFAGSRGDQHAGGVETCLVEHINPDLLDPMWPRQPLDKSKGVHHPAVQTLIAGQMGLQQAIQLSGDLPEFIAQAQSTAANGIVGDIGNYFQLDAADLMQRILAVSSDDIGRLTLANGMVT